MPDRLIVVEHPVLADRLAVLRDRATLARRRSAGALEEASAILAIEATRDLPTRDVTVDTPLEPAHGTAPARRGRDRARPARRAWAWSTASCACCPTPASATSGCTATRRTTRPSTTTSACRPGSADAHVIVPDPMLATGGSAVHALRPAKEAGAQRLRLVCLVSAPEGVAAVHEAHPDVPIWTAALDRELDDNAFIRPGLGDAGDRVFGTSG